MSSTTGQRPNCAFWRHLRNMSSSNSSIKVDRFLAIRSCMADLISLEIISSSIVRRLSEARFSCLTFGSSLHQSQLWLTMVSSRRSKQLPTQKSVHIHYLQSSFLKGVLCHVYMAASRFVIGETISGWEQLHLQMLYIVGCIKEDLLDRDSSYFVWFWAGRPLQHNSVLWIKFYTSKN